MTEQEKIVDKIKKLFELSNSPSEAESESAVRKAHELLVKYHISLNDLEVKSVDDINDIVVEGAKSWLSTWLKLLNGIVAKHFYCLGYTQRKCNESSSLRIAGKKLDVQFCEYTFNYLKNTFESLAKENYKDYTSQNTYLMGLVSGLQQKFVDQLKCEKEQGLVLYNNIQKILNYNLRNSRGSGSISDRSIFEHGKEDGKNVQLRSGIEAKAKYNGNYLN